MFRDIFENTDLRTRGQRVLFLKIFEKIKKTLDIYNVL